MAIKQAEKTPTECLHRENRFALKPRWWWALLLSWIWHAVCINTSLFTTFPYITGLILKEFPLKSPHDALLFYACRPCFAFFGSSALISQTGSRRVIPDQGLLCWRMPYLLFSSLGTSALWGPRLMCDDVYCLLICPFSGFQGPERDRSCGGAIKGGRFRVILWFVRMILRKTKKSHIVLPTSIQGYVWFEILCRLRVMEKHRHPCECILRIWNVFVRSPVLISELHKSVILHIKHWVV